MTCIHGMGSNVVDYVICDTHVLNRMENFELLNEHELDSEHRPFSLTLNLVMHNIQMQKKCEIQRYTHFDRSK